jgi:hypothetical protein
VDEVEVDIVELHLLEGLGEVGFGVRLVGAGDLGGDEELLSWLFRLFDCLTKFGFVAVDCSSGYGQCVSIRSIRDRAYLQRHQSGCSPSSQPGEWSPRASCPGRRCWLSWWLWLFQRHTQATAIRIIPQKIRQSTYQGHFLAIIQCKFWNWCHFWSNS